MLQVAITLMRHSYDLMAHVSVLNSHGTDLMVHACFHMTNTNMAKVMLHSIAIGTRRSQERSTKPDFTHINTDDITAAWRRTYHSELLPLCRETIFASLQLILCLIDVFASVRRECTPPVSF